MWQVFFTHSKKTFDLKLTANDLLRQQTALLVEEIFHRLVPDFLERGKGIPKRVILGGPEHNFLVLGARDEDASRPVRHLDLDYRAVLVDHPEEHLVDFVLVEL